MDKNWSKLARAALDAYPWHSPQEKAQAQRETELVSFGEEVLLEELPLEVRLYWRQAQKCAPHFWHWKGESWKELTQGFEKKVLRTVLEAHQNSITRTAKALRTTPRIISYKAHQYGLIHPKQK